MKKINKIAPDDSPYLQVLDCLSEIPKTLYYIGTIPSERRPSVAIIGTRKPTRYGREVTEQLSETLARRGVVIVSGLALGIDAIAHQSAVLSAARRSLCRQTAYINFIRQQIRNLARRSS